MITSRDDAITTMSVERCQDLVPMLLEYDTECGDGFRLEDYGVTHNHWCNDMFVMALRNEAASALRFLLEKINETSAQTEA